MILILVLPGLFWTKLFSPVFSLSGECLFSGVTTQNPSLLSAPESILSLASWLSVCPPRCISDGFAPVSSGRCIISVPSGFLGFSVLLLLFEFWSGLSSGRSLTVLMKLGRLFTCKGGPSAGPGLCAEGCLLARRLCCGAGQGPSTFGGRRSAPPVAKPRAQGRRLCSPGSALPGACIWEGRGRHREDAGSQSVCWL